MGEFLSIFCGTQLKIFFLIKKNNEAYVYLHQLKTFFALSSLRNYFYQMSREFFLQISQKQIHLSSIGMQPTVLPDHMQTTPAPSLDLQ